MNKNGFGLIGVIIAIGIVALLIGGGLYLNTLKQKQSIEEETENENIVLHSEFYCQDISRSDKLSKLYDPNRSPGVIYIIFQDKVNQIEIDNIIKEIDAEIVKKGKGSGMYFDKDAYYVIFDPPKTNYEASNVALELRKNPDITFVGSVGGSPDDVEILKDIFGQNFTEDLFGKSMLPKELMSDFVKAAEEENIDKMVKYFQSPGEYRDIFIQAKESGQLKKIAESLKTIEEKDIGEKTAIFKFRFEDEEGDILTDYIMLSKDEFDCWFISSF